MSAFFAAGLLCLSAQLTPIPVILDTDIGSDIDDTWALAMLLGSPQVDVKLIVTAFDDAPTKTRLLAKMLEQTGHTGIPIGTGIKTSDRKLNQREWLGDYQLDSYKGVVHQDGVQAIIDCINQAPSPLTLCALGPETNIAEALRRDPGIAAKARVVAMAGSVYIGYRGKPERDSEYNVNKDIAAVRAVFAAPWDITFAPLDSCGNYVLKGEAYRQVAASNNPLAVLVMQNYASWVHRDKYPETESSILFDTLAAYLAFDEELLGMETVKLSVDDKGNTVPEEANGRPVHCALKFKDEAGFSALLVQTLTKNPAVPDETPATAASQPATTRRTP